MAKHPYSLIDGLTGAVVCVYKTKSIALRDCAKKNAGERRFYVFVPRTGQRITA